MNDMPHEPAAADPFSEAAVALRREAALKRMLTTPHTPHDALAAMRRKSATVRLRTPRAAEDPQ
jgi:hypothetical protein